METTPEELRNDNKFLELVRLEVPAKNLQYFAPDRSVRWLQQVCKDIRDDYGTVKCDDFTFIELDSKPTKNKVGYKVPTINLPIETNWFKLTGDFALISDIHIPFYHAPTIERLMEESHSEDITKCIIMGDLVDFNMFNHKRGSQHSRRAQEDVEVARPVLKSMLQQFEEIYVFMGNHDDWLKSHMRNHFDSDWMFGKFFGDMPQIKWSSHGQCDVTSGDKFWKLLHGSHFSASNPLGVAKNYASKYQANVVVGHQHRAEDGFDISGKFRCVCLGGAYDPDKMGYLHYQPFNSGTSKRSVALLKDGVLKHITDV